MCTVTYLPAKSGYILSSNRDESPGRAHTPVVTENIGISRVTFPKDPKGGSWIFTDDLKRTVVVLNGAFEKHSHQPPYRKSRGVIAREFYAYNDSIEYIRNLDLHGIEPFTMVIFDGHNLLEFRWDENIKHLSRKDATIPHIWSSSTLYAPGVQAKRKKWFEENLPKQKYYNLDIARKVHRGGDIGDPEQNYIMNRENLVRTVSISHVSVNHDESRLTFEKID